MEQVPEGWKRHPDKKSLTFDKPGQTSTEELLFVIFGGLAVMVTFGDGRPMALRRRLSPVLPLSDVVLYRYYNTRLQIKHCSGIPAFIAFWKAIKFLQVHIQRDVCHLVDVTEENII